MRASLKPPETAGRERGHLGYLCVQRIGRHRLGLLDDLFPNLSIDCCRVVGVDRIAVWLMAEDRPPYSDS